MATREETKQMIEVMQAYVDGKEIQHSAIQNPPDQGWLPTDNPTWETYRFMYRVKPEPREWLIVPKLSAWVYSVGSRDAAAADVAYMRTGAGEIVHVREVLNE